MVIGVKRSAPAAERNASAIQSVLERVLPARGLVLELASGTGQHAAHMAAALPDLVWQPSDADRSALASIAAWVADSGLPNLRPPIELDVTVEPWPIDRAGAVLCINMIHIAPWSAALAMLRGAARVLEGAAPCLVTYGPYAFDGRFTAPSNAEFDASLRARDPDWGVRDVRDIEAAAGAVGLDLIEVVAMPANNHCLLFRPRPESVHP